MIIGKGEVILYSERVFSWLDAFVLLVYYAFCTKRREACLLETCFVGLLSEASERRWHRFTSQFIPHSGCWNSFGQAVCSSPFCPLSY